MRSAGREAYSYRRDPAVPPFPDDRPIIIFDGYCALCSGWAQLVLRHDRTARYRLLRAQSPLGYALYVHYGLDPQDYETNILIEDGAAGSSRKAASAWPKVSAFPGHWRRCSASCRCRCVIEFMNSWHATG
jgi:predicted DCC family thiol-disulfide oxidoreductase YuxK